MSDKAQKTIRIKWVRSGIGFTYHQKRIVRSLGLKKLNQEVERPDTPQIRGLVEKAPHLLKIVEATSKAAWTLVPEYTIYPPQAALSKPAETTLEAPTEGTEKTEAPVSPPLAPLPSGGGESGMGAAGAATGTSDSGAGPPTPPATQAAAETAKETSEKSVAAEATEPAGANGADGTPAGEEAPPEGRQSEA